MNTIRVFDPSVEAKLGEYVYALRDPRDKKVFYIGKGNRNRLFDHFNDAESASKNNGPWTAKLRRIVEIWEADEDVDWFVLRRDVGSTVTSFDIEAAIIDALEISQNGPALNDIAGHSSTLRGILTAQDVSALSAPMVNPCVPYRTVFIFPIHNALSDGTSIYDATRGLWGISESLRMRNDALAVGVAKGLSKGVFSIANWAQAQTPGKWEFNGTRLAGHALEGKNWLMIINSSIGYWQRGNYLVIEFDGQGNYRFIRGSPQKSTWRLLS